MTADPDVVAGARRAVGGGGPAAADAYARSALSIGARAVSVATGTADVDALAGRVDRLAVEITGAARESAKAIQAAVDAAADPSRARWPSPCGSPSPP